MTKAAGQLVVSAMEFDLMDTGFKISQSCLKRASNGETDLAFTLRNMAIATLIVQSQSAQV